MASQRRPGFSDDSQQQANVEQQEARPAELSEPTNHEKMEVREPDDRK